MKNILRFLFLLLMFSSCTNSRYILKDSGKDKKFLIETIKEMHQNGQISQKPILVIDGVPLRFEKELKEKKLSLTKDNIEKIQLLKKEIGIKIYGEFAQGGVLVITTKSSSNEVKSEN